MGRKTTAELQLSAHSRQLEPQVVVSASLMVGPDKMSLYMYVAMLPDGGFDNIEVEVVNMEGRHLRAQTRLPMRRGDMITHFDLKSSSAAVDDGNDPYSRGT